MAKQTMGRRKIAWQEMDWGEIDTVLLDMDGTLLDLHFDNHFWLEHLPNVMAAKTDKDPQSSLATLKSLYQQHVGTLNWYCVDFWNGQLGFDIMVHKAEVAHKIAYRPKAQLFLERCQRNSDDVRLVTNAHRKILNFKIQHTQIDQYFDQMVCSHELDHPKEQVEFWERLQRHQAFDPARTLFLDDNESVLESAAEYGIARIFSIAKPDMRLERATPSRFTMIEDLV